MAEIKQDVYADTRELFQAVTSYVKAAKEIAALTEDPSVKYKFDKMAKLVEKTYVKPPEPSHAFEAREIMADVQEMLLRVQETLSKSEVEELGFMPKEDGALLQRVKRYMRETVAPASSAATYIGKDIPVTTVQDSPYVRQQVNPFSGIENKNSFGGST